MRQEIMKAYFTRAQFIRLARVMRLGDLFQANLGWCLALAG